MMDNTATPCAEISAGERAKTIVAFEAMLRILRKAADCFPDEDIETIIVFMTVATASTSRHLRDPAILDLVDQAPLPDHLHRPTSGRAVAEASGLPRETVRRRINDLVKAGLLKRDRGGVRTTSGLLNRADLLEFARFTVQELSTVSARLSRLDRS